MELRTRLHQKLAEGEPACGIFLALNCPESAELIVHRTELDWVGVDLQHVAVTAADSAHMLRTAQAADPQVTPLARIPCHGVYWVQQSLDAGYAGVIVPLTESAAQAEDLVRATYFPPRGDRSNAGSIRASLYGDHVAISNDAVVLLPQIESAAGLEHVEEIVAVEGVSGVLLGPEDLSISCGWRGKDLWRYPPFLDAVRRIIAACEAHGKYAAVLTGAYMESREMGFHIIGFSADSVHIKQIMVPDVNAKLAELRQPLTAAPAAEADGASAGAAERIRTYRASLDRFNQWVEANLNPDGSWCEPCLSYAFFAIASYGAFIGRRDWAISVLRYVERTFMNEDGSLQQSEKLVHMVSYAPSWFARAAFEAEMFDLSTRLLDYAASFQSAQSGGFFAGTEQRDAGSGAIGFDATTMSAVTMARCGKPEAAAKAADFLVRLYEAQPCLNEKFYTDWSEPEGLLTEEQGAADASILEWDKPLQFYYKAGLFTMALASAYGVTGQAKHLETAIALHDTVIERATDLWTNTIAHKVCWAAVTLNLITGEARFLDQACRLADHLVTVQHEDGYYNYPNYWDSFPPVPWEKIPIIVPQFALWIARTLSALEAACAAGK